MSFETLTTDTSDGILTITLNRTEILNAFSGGMLHDLCQAVDLADVDDDIGAIIITGAGRGFCAGQDLSQGESTWEGHEEQLAGTKHGDGGSELSRPIFRRLKPVIVAFNSPAVGLGITFT